MSNLETTRWRILFGAGVLVVACEGINTVDDGTSIATATLTSPAGAGAGFGGSPKSLSLDEGSTFDAPNATDTIVGFRAVLYDDGGNWNYYAKHYTAPAVGDYHVCASAATFTQDFELVLFVNGTREKTLAVSRYGAASGCRTVKLQGSDVLDLRVYQTAVPTLHFESNLYWNWLTIGRGTLSSSVDNIEAFTAQPGVFAKVPYNTELFDSPRNEFDPASSRFVPSYQGDYRFCASAAATQPFELDLFVNGARERAFAVEKRGVGTGCRTIRLAAGDYVEVKTYAFQGAQFVANKARNWLTIDQPQTLFSSLGSTLPFVAASGQFQTVPYTNSLLSQDPYYNPATGKFTAPANTKYQFCASLANFTQDFELDLFINGIRENAFVLSSYGAAIGCRTIRLNAGDTVEVKVYQASGSPMSVSPNGIWNWLTVEMG
jgi:hypothetical protein